MENKSNKIEPIYFNNQRNHKSIKISESISYYDNSDFPWVPKLEKKIDQIKKEIINFLDENPNELKPYFDKTLINNSYNWKQTGFFFWGLTNSKAIRKCPVTVESLMKIPHIISASISVLNAQSEIKGHYGDTNAIFRCHYPIKVPGKLPQVGFEVNNEQRSWEEGKLLIFNDFAYHRAWNFKNERRIVLLIDVIKPEYINKKRWICSNVISELGIKSLGNNLVTIFKRNLIKNIFRAIFFRMMMLYFLFNRKLM